jgi:hypothetical protein
MFSFSLIGVQRDECGMNTFIGAAAMEPSRGGV